nr:external alternative NAD(P)H-ubiquinone oxidoreductase B1, mitochondrial isoform X2 [Hydra vulgaris]
MLLSRTLLRAQRHKFEIIRKSFTYSEKNTNWTRVYRLIKVGSFATVGFAVCVVLANEEEAPKKKLVILGSGWGAMSLLKSLKPGLYDISVVSPTNYFVFTPLLTAVTVGNVQSNSIIEPVRKILTKRYKNTGKFYEAECTSIDIENKKVTCHDKSVTSSEFCLDYDYVVVAIGAETATFNIQGVKENTHFLKSVHDAHAIRKHIMDSFESAAIPGQSDKELQRLLHFVVVGAGPTGVEFSAQLHDFVKDDLQKYYPKHLIEKAQITLIDGLKRVLYTFSEDISSYTEELFKKQGINVVTSTFVTGIEKTQISLQDSQTKKHSVMPFGLCVWCGGITPRELTKKVINQIPGQNNKLYNSKVLKLESEGSLSLKDLHSLAKIVDSKKNSLAPTAQVAYQEGVYLGKLLNEPEMLDNEASFVSAEPFLYNHLGTFVYIGNNQAVLESPKIGDFKGYSAFWMWKGVYASKCISLRMRCYVIFDWMKSYLFGRDISRS